MVSKLATVTFAAFAATVAVSASAQAPSAPPPAAAPSAPSIALPGVDEAVARVQAFYDKTTSFQSDFSQEFLVKAYNQRKASRGTVTFLKPGRVDWAYVEPGGNRVVSDGVTLKVYEAQNKQMYEQPVNASQYPAALSFLTGQGKLADAFKFEMHDGEKYGMKGGFVLVGEPKTPTPAYRTVLFYIDANTSQVRRVMIVDGQGNRNRFDFLTPKVNVKVDPGQFRFAPPPGTSIVRP